MSEPREFDGTDFDGHRCRHLLGPEWMKRDGPGEAEKTRARGMRWGRCTGSVLAPECLRLSHISFFSGLEGEATDGGMRGTWDQVGEEGVGSPRNRVSQH